MPSSSSSLFNIPQLAEDGSNWVTYKHRMTIALGARGLGEYVDGTVPIPTRYVADSAGILQSAPGKPATADKSRRIGRKSMSIRRKTHSSNCWIPLVRTLVRALRAR
jgi:hypothetical protein